MQSHPSGLYAKYFKRLLDVITSLALLCLLSWLFLFIFLLYLVSFQFPVFFIQERTGKNEKTFRLIKFRTLKQRELPLAERKFPLGNLLRSTSLDELPQLINVLKGEMSLVGPRPLPLEYLPLFSPEQRNRFAVLPGVTGWAQVNGRHSIPWEEKFKLDLFYVNNLSFSLDMKILIKTGLLLLSFKKDSSLEEGKFTGKGDV